jgi:hypothetical protein
LDGALDPRLKFISISLGDKMPNVKKHYTIEEAMGAIDRSNGHELTNGPGSPRPVGQVPDGRIPYNNTGKKQGHEYMHRGHIEQRNHSGDHPSGLVTLSQLQKNMLKKSRTENRYTSARLTQYLLNSTQGQQALDELDNNVGNPQKWIQNIPVTDGTIYGFEQNGDVPKQVTSAAINIRKIGGELFIASVYPMGFSGERNYELDTFF